MGLAEEFRSGNFSLYGQWFGLASIITLITLNILFINIPWSIFGWIIAFLLIFIEVPFCLKFCPTSSKFDNFLNQFQNSYYRAAAYILFAVILWIDFAVIGRYAQVANAILLTGAAVSYTISALRHQTPASSTITGGTGVSTIV